MSPQNTSPTSAPFASEDSSLEMGEPGWLHWVCHQWTGSTPLLTFSPSSARTTDLCSPLQSHPLEPFFAGRWGGKEIIWSIFWFLSHSSSKWSPDSIWQGVSMYRKKAWSCVWKRRGMENVSENSKTGRGEEGALPSWLLKLRTLAKTTDTCAQKERTWTTTSSWGGKGGFVEHFLVKGDKRTPALLAWWPVIPCLVPWCAHREW